MNIKVLTLALRQIGRKVTENDRNIRGISEVVGMICTVQYKVRDVGQQRRSFLPMYCSKVDR